MAHKYCPRSILCANSFETYSSTCKVVVAIKFRLENLHFSREHFILLHQLLNNQNVIPLERQHEHITLCILCHQEALVSSFPPSKEENIRAWCAFPIQDMPEVVKKKVTCNNDSLIVRRVGYLLDNYSKQIHTQTRVQNEYFYNQRTSSLREEH